MVCLLRNKSVNKQYELQKGEDLVHWNKRMTYMQYILQSCQKKSTSINHTAIISINYATPILDPSYCHNLSKRKLHSSPPQDVRLLPVWDSWTEIRAFSRAVSLSQLVWTLSKWNLACWGRKHSRFGLWVYFGIWGGGMIYWYSRPSAAAGMQGSLLVHWSPKDALFQHLTKFYISHIKNL